MAHRLNPHRASAVVIAGCLWAQMAFAVRILVLETYLPLGDRISEGVVGRVASWTLLAPLEAAIWCMAPIAHSNPGAAAAAAVWLCQLIGVSICAFVTAGVLSTRWRRAVVSGVAALVLVGVACGAVVAAQLRDAFVAEKAFFAMMNRAVEPQKDAAMVSACREFVEHHERSRWAGEALKIVAMAEWDAGRISASERLWQRFAARFRDRGAPGVAYAEYSMALCALRRGDCTAARGHLRAALEIIRVRGDGIQTWIVVEAAERLEAVERAEGRLALADYWKSKSVTFESVYPIE